jgi:hypothetical protein
MVEGVKVRHSQRLTIKVPAVVVLLTLACGWRTSVGQLVDGSGTASGTAWLLAMSAAATLGGLALLVAHRRCRRLITATALVLVALSPTVFAYPLNLAVLALAVAELALPRQARPAAISPR